MCRSIILNNLIKTFCICCGMCGIMNHSFSQAENKEKYTISGYILEEESDEPIIGCKIFIPSIGDGVISNEYGFYSITLPAGKHTLKVKYIGKESVEKEVNLIEDITLDINLMNHSIMTKSVIVQAEKKIGDPVITHKIDTKKIIEQPAILGEPDVLKTVQLLPGISSSSETGISFSVRGGSPSQNLILLDEAPVYNPYHLLGIVSAFNPYTLKSVDLYRDAIPAEYQAGASSVIDIHTKDGNKKKYGGEFGIGLLGARISAEGPIIKDKLSFTASYRKSILSDIISAFANDEDGLAIRYNDINAKLSWKINKNNQLFGSYYRGADVFLFGEDGGNRWINNTATLTSTSVLTKKLFLRNTFAFSQFTTGFSYFSEDKTEFGTNQTISSFKLKNEFKWYQSPSFKTIFGLSTDYQKYLPFNFFVTKDGENIYKSEFSPQETVIELAPYLGVKKSFGKRIKLYAGVRAPISAWFPEKEERIYYDIETDLIDTLFFKQKTFFKLEPRVSFSYNISENKALIFGFQRINQFKQNFSSGAVFSIATFWKPSSAILAPQTTNQFFLKYSHEYSSFKFNISGYYKDIEDVSDFVDGAFIIPGYNSSTLDESQLGLVELGTILKPGIGRSKGIEFSITKTNGKLTGDISYTLAKSMLKIEGINNGEWYPSIFDRRHDLNILLTYSLSERNKFTALFSYNSGQPVDLPNNNFNLYGADFSLSTSKNSYRKPNFHRLDISFIHKGKERKNIETQWIFSIINVYNQFNPTFLRVENDKIIGQNLVPFLPSLSYQIKLK